MLDLAVELSISTAMVLLTVVIHGFGLLGLGRMVARGGSPHLNPLSRDGAVTAIGMVVALLVLHGAEIWLYAFLFQLLGAITDLREAVYFSTLSYAAIGYGDAAILPDWKLLGALEGINGVLLLGWTTAYFVTQMERFSGRRPRR